MHSTKVSFDNGRGQRLSGIMEIPVDDHPIAYAVFAHCFTCSKNYKAVRHISRALATEGFAVLSFDFTGLGDSEGDFAETSLASNVDDIVAAAEMLEASYEAPSLLIGHSLGGAAAIMAAPRLASVDAVVTIASPASLDNLAERLEPARSEIEREGQAEIDLAGRRIRIGRSLIRDLDEIEMSSAIADLDRPLLIMHSPADTVVDIENASEIFRTAGHPKSFISLDPADHLLNKTEDSRYAAGVVAAWARKYVGAAERDAQATRSGHNRVVARTGADGYRTEILADGHPLVSDEPVSAGGTNTGPSPYELLAAALGACTGITLRMYADRKQWPLDEIEISLRHEKRHCDDCADAESGSPKMDHLHRELRLEGDLDEEQRDRLREIADRCPVHRTLRSEVEITTELVDD